jgi:hypothetical protein
MTANEYDPHAAFIAKDGLEYQDLAAYLEGTPVECFRNRRIQEHRARGGSEAAIRLWIKGYDGDDPTPSHLIEASNERVKRIVRANGQAGFYDLNL